MGKRLSLIWIATGEWERKKVRANTAPWLKEQVNYQPGVWNWGNTAAAQSCWWWCWLLDKQKGIQTASKRKGIKALTLLHNLRSWFWKRYLCLQGIWGAMALLARHTATSKAGLMPIKKIFYAWYQGALQGSEMDQTFLHITRRAKGSIWYSTKGNKHYKQGT